MNFLLSALLICSTVAAAPKVTIPPTTTVPATTIPLILQPVVDIFVKTQDFASSFSKFDYKADPSFSRAAEANFCPTFDGNGEYYWCYNGVSILLCIHIYNISNNLQKSFIIFKYI